MHSLVRHSWIAIFALAGCGDDATGSGGEGGSSQTTTATTGGPTTSNTTTASTTTSSGNTTSSTGGGLSCFGEAYVSEIGPGIECGQLFSTSDWMEGPVMIEYAPPAIELKYGPYTFTGTVANDGSFVASYPHNESVGGDSCSPWAVDETLSGTVNLDDCTITATYTYAEAPTKTSDYCIDITCPVETAPISISPEGSACAGVFTGPMPGIECVSCLKESCCDLVAACGAESTCVECFLGDSASCTPAASEAADALAACADTNCQAACEVEAYPADCEASLPAASGGSCMPPLDSTYQCNLLTNEGCTGTDICYVDGSDGTYCDQPFSATPAGLCESCDGDCGAGLICIGYSEPGSSRCAAYCCSDSDCGTGATCNLFLGAILGGAQIGVCED